MNITSTEKQLPAALSRDEVAKIITLWESSGITQKEICRQHQLSYSRFQYWRKKLRVSRPRSDADGFVAVRMKQGHSFHGHHPLVEVICPDATVRADQGVSPDGKRVNFYTAIKPAQLRALIA